MSLSTCGPIGSSSTCAKGRVIICVDRSDEASDVVRHAAAIAESLGKPATLLHIIETTDPSGNHADPVEWELRRRDARQMLSDLARGHDKTLLLETEVDNGYPADQICRRISNTAADIVAFGASTVNDAPTRRLGNTVRRVLELSSSSVLVVPRSGSGSGAVVYRRILLPLDGSPRAESVLPLAARIAEAHGAELVLIHVAQIPEMIEMGPSEPEDIAIRTRIMKRNERVARMYLERIKAKLAAWVPEIRIRLCGHEDVRRCLADLITEERADLVILSAKGRSARADSPVGSVAAHLLDHVHVPILIARLEGRNTFRGAGRTQWNRPAVRLPGHFMS
jgi:nucleotide-binding universal stress UspA family protein